MINLKQGTNSYFRPDSNVLNSYLSEISKYSILAEKDIRKLIVKAKLGDAKSLDKVVKSYQRFVFSMSKRLCKGNQQLVSDLISEANIGLIKSIYTFDLSMGTKFLTHSVFWMQKQIFEYLAFTDPSIKITNSSKIKLKVKKITNNFLLTEGRQPTTNEIIDLLYEKHGIEITNESYAYQLEIKSINDNAFTSDYSNNDSDVEFLASDSLSSKNKYEEIIENDYSKVMISKLICTLSEKEKDVIRLLYGIDQYNECSIQDVANKLGISSEGVRLIDKRAKTKMLEKAYIYKYTI